MGLFSSSFFRRKDITHLIGEMDDGERLNRRLGPVRPDGAGHRRHDRHGPLRSNRLRRQRIRRPSIILSFLLAAIGCGFAAFCYSELASMVPVAGSAYTYAYATMGELVAWIIGWDLILEYAIASGAVAAGWSNYLDAFLHNVFHVQLDPRLSSAPWDYDIGQGTFMLKTVALGANAAGWLPRDLMSRGAPFTLAKRSGLPTGWSGRTRCAPRAWTRAASAAQPERRAVTMWAILGSYRVRSCPGVPPRRRQCRPVRSGCGTGRVHLPCGAPGGPVESAEARLGANPQRGA